MSFLSWLSSSSDNDTQQEETFLESMEAEADERGFAFRREPMIFIHTNEDPEGGFWIRLVK